MSKRNAFPVTLLSYSGYKEIPFYNVLYAYIVSSVTVSGNCFTAYKFCMRDDPDLVAPEIWRLL